MSERRRLPNRRASETFDIESQGLRFTATVSRFADGRIAEIFLQNHRAGSSAGINAQYAAFVCSIALQYGVPLDVIRRALMRDPQGRASGPLGTALDTLGGCTMRAAYEAVENIRALDRRDALALADEIVDDVIAALQRDRYLSPHSFTEWSLTLADLRARIAERIADEIEGHIDRETALLELKAVTGWEELLDA